MPKKFKTVIWAVPLAAATLILLWIVFVIVALPYLPWRFVYSSEIHRGNKIISKIEDFRNQYHRLPNLEKTEEMTPLGFELLIGYRPEFRPFGDDAYEIEYYIGFDGPRIIYSSKAKQWHCELCN
jgi:hypothetical protein